MPPGSLYDSGWRQGSVLRTRLKALAIIENSGSLEPVEQEHEVWVVVTQDCDLDFLLTDNNDPLVELRPVHHNTSGSWGIRSRRLRLDDAQSMESQDPRLMISPAALHAVRSQRVEALRPERTLSLKTWLGLRYDRPAVPPEFVDLARAIGTQVENLSEPVSDRVRDVIMEFNDSTNPPLFSLFAVLENEEDAVEAREWLWLVSQAIPPELGVAESLEAATSDGTALSLIEMGYSADLTQLTWGREGPTGAY